MKRRIHNPGRRHLPGATPKQQRQYEHILRSELSRGAPLKTAKRIAAATVRARANPYKRICIRNPKTGELTYYDLVIKKQAEYTPKGWKYGRHTYKKGRGTQKLSGNNYLDLNTGYVYAKRARNAMRRNVQMGYWDMTGFHPIRKSSDYDPDRLFEPEDYQYKPGA
ncbi:MAG: hypothetical protein J2P31_19960, partial [Blastocatellia bacterium]|nr:hypothetical protein [Blastocatellia bacterium]